MRRLQPVAANSPGWFVPRQSAQQEDGGDLAARPVRVYQLRQGLSVGRTPQSCLDLGKTEVQQQAALGGGACLKLLGNREPHQRAQVDVRRDVLFAQTDQRVAAERMPVVREQRVARGRGGVVDDQGNAT